MLTWLVALVLGALAQSAAAGNASFDFTRTMRVDYVHTGGPAAGETLALDRVVNDGAWAGSRTELVDTTNLGKYLFEVREPASGRVLYSRGFASIYGEWETTSEVKTVNRSFHESLRFPWPATPVRVILQKRQADNRFAQIWSTDIDPESRFVNRATLKAHAGTVWNLFENGPSHQKVDLLVIGEGYTQAELPKFHKDASRLVEALFAQEPFKSRRRDFNVRALDLPSAESGVNRPNAGVFRRTPISTEYNIFDSERYLLTLDNRALRDAASAAPYEFIEILVNERTYGGGGIFNDQATAAVDSAFADYVFVHEFGHHFAALADEYYTSLVAYLPTGAREEPWEANITANPKSPKWRDMVEAGTPLPTPWQKQEYEMRSRAAQAKRAEIRKQNRPESDMEALFQEERQMDQRQFPSEKYFGKVGAFEGARYEAQGFFRPEVDCIMFTRSEQFCAVCRRALTRVIDSYVR